MLDKIMDENNKRKLIQWINSMTVQNNILYMHMIMIIKGVKEKTK